MHEGKRGGRDSQKKKDQKKEGSVVLPNPKRKKTKISSILVWYFFGPRVRYDVVSRKSTRYNCNFPTIDTHRGTNGALTKVCRIENFDRRRPFF